MEFTWPIGDVHYSIYIIKFQIIGWQPINRTAVLKYSEARRKKKANLNALVNSIRIKLIIIAT